MQKYSSITDMLFLIQIFEEMADLSGQVIRSVQSGDEGATRHSIDAIRQNHADLSNQIEETELAVLVDRLDGDLKLRLSISINKINAAKPLIQAWCCRFEGIYKESDYFTCLVNIHAHIDFLIPATWSWGQDLLILMGEFPQQYFEALLSRGQKRVICIGSSPMGLSCPYNFVGDENEILPLVVSISRPPPKKMKLFALSNFPKLIDFEKIQKLITDSVNLSWMNYNTTNNFGRKWVDQGISNLNTISKSRNWTCFAKNNKNKNAIIISPGPSLDKNIEQLVDVSGDICLIAPAQSLKILNKYKIYPDLVVVVDPADLVYLFDGVDLSKIPGLLASPTCFPGVLELPFNNIFIFDGNQISDRWIMDIFDDQAIGASGGSVSVDCLLFALKCGFEKIALVGQDLALTGGRQYAKNSASGNIVVDINPETGEASLSGFSDAEIGSLDYFRENSGISTRSSKLLSVPGYYGGFVGTLPDYYQFHSQFERIAKDINSESVLLYNCTEGGAYIFGFNHIPLLSFLSLIPVEPKSSLFFPVHQLDRRSIQLSTFLSRNVQNINKLIDDCNTAIALIFEIMNSSLNSTLRAELVVVEGRVLDLVSSMNFLSIGIQCELDFIIKVIGRSKNISDSIRAELSLFELILGESVRVSSMLLEQQLALNKGAAS